MPGFKFWKNDNNPTSSGFLGNIGSGALGGGVGGMAGSMSGMFSGFGNSGGGPTPLPTPQAPPPATGGFFSNMGASMPFNNAASGPPLHIHCAAYADRDITQTCRRLITNGTTLELDTDGDGLVKVFGDPWPGNTKSISILYSYGQRPWEMITSADRCGKLTLIPHQPLDNDRMGFIKSAQSSRVIAVTWGRFPSPPPCDPPSFSFNTKSHTFTKTP